MFAKLDRAPRTTTQNTQTPHTQWKQQQAMNKKQKLIALEQIAA